MMLHASDDMQRTSRPKAAADEQSKMKSLAMQQEQQLVPNLAGIQFSGRATERAFPKAGWPGSTGTGNLGSGLTTADGTCSRKRAHQTLRPVGLVLTQEKHNVRVILARTAGCARYLIRTHANLAGTGLCSVFLCTSVQSCEAVPKFQSRVEPGQLPFGNAAVRVLLLHSGSRPDWERLLFCCIASELHPLPLSAAGLLTAGSLQYRRASSIIPRSSWHTRAASGVNSRFYVYGGCRH